jgi:hypothetical protein
MGSSKSKTETNIVNEALTSVALSSSQNCSSSNANTQEITFNDIRVRGCSLRFSDISQSMKVQQNFTCLQDSSQSADLLSKFKTELDAKTEAAVTGFGIGKAEAETITNLTNKIKNDINISTVANCMSSNMNNQKQTYGKIDVECSKGDEVTFDNISQKLIATQVAKCVQSDAKIASVANEIDNKLKLHTSATVSGIPDSSASLASLGSFLIPIIVSIVVSVLFMFLMLAMQ